MTIPTTELKDGTSVYVTVDGDTVDAVARDFYGTHIGTSELVYATNQDLSLRPFTLPAGVRIVLPSYTPPEPPGQIKLWD